MAVPLPVSITAKRQGESPNLSKPTSLGRDHCAEVGYSVQGHPPSPPPPLLHVPWGSGWSPPESLQGPRPAAGKREDLLFACAHQVSWTHPRHPRHTGSALLLPQGEASAACSWSWKKRAQRTLVATPRSSGICGPRQLGHTLAMGSSSPDFSSPSASEGQRADEAFRFCPMLWI